MHSFFQGFQRKLAKDLAKSLTTDQQIHPRLNYDFFHCDGLS